VRFWVESRTLIVDEKSGKQEEFLQCASCKSENTFAPRDLFHTDNYDFLPVFGSQFGLIFRRKAGLNANYREVRPATQLWDGQKLSLREARRAVPLGTSEEIRKATHQGWPLVAQTVIASQETGLRATLEFPVKTMNIHDEKDLYQVDTGPVAFPDLTRRWDRLVDSLSLAFVAFNTPEFADFVIEDETPVARCESETVRVRHYSRLVSLPAKNRLFWCRP
jgi:hypothetical protein